MDGRALISDITPYGSRSLSFEDVTPLLRAKEACCWFGAVVKLSRGRWKSSVSEGLLWGAHRPTWYICAVRLVRIRFCGFVFVFSVRCDEAHRPGCSSAVTSCTARFFFQSTFHSEYASHCSVKVAAVLFLWLCSSVSKGLVDRVGCKVWLVFRWCSADILRSGSDCSFYGYNSFKVSFVYHLSAFEKRC